MMEYMQTYRGPTVITTSSRFFCRMLSKLCRTVEVVNPRARTACRTGLTVDTASRGIVTMLVAIQAEQEENVRITNRR